MNIRSLYFNDILTMLQYDAIVTAIQLSHKIRQIFRLIFELFEVNRSRFPKDPMVISQICQYESIKSNITKSIEFIGLNVAALPMVWEQYRPIDMDYLQSENMIYADDEMIDHETFMDHFRQFGYSEYEKAQSISCDGLLFSVMERIIRSLTRLANNIKLLIPVNGKLEVNPIGARNKVSTIMQTLQFDVDYFVWDYKSDVQRIYTHNSLDGDLYTRYYQYDAKSEEDDIRTRSVRRPITWMRWERLTYKDMVIIGHLVNNPTNYKAIQTKTKDAANGAPGTIRSHFGSEQSTVFPITAPLVTGGYNFNRMESRETLYQHAITFLTIKHWMRVQSTKSWNKNKKKGMPDPMSIVDEMIQWLPHVDRVLSFRERLTQLPDIVKDCQKKIVEKLLESIDGGALFARQYIDLLIFGIWKGVSYEVPRKLDMARSALKGYKLMHERLTACVKCHDAVILRDRTNCDNVEHMTDLLEGLNSSFDWSNAYSILLQ